MDTMISEERVIGRGPTHQVDASIIETGIAENQTEKDMKIVDNFTVVENGTILVVKQDLHLFVNMVPELRRFVKVIMVHLNIQTHLLFMESNMKLLERK